METLESDCLFIGPMDEFIPGPPGRIGDPTYAFGGADTRFGLGPIMTLFPGTFPGEPWLIGLNPGR